MVPHDTQSDLSLGHKILNISNKLSAFPGGRLLFSKILGHKIPYSGTIGARVVELKPGHAKFILKDRKAIRNHLNSIHAIALTNFGEITSGLALNTCLPNNVRSIVIRITTDYLKKARGTLTAECRCEPPTVTTDMDYTVEANIKDQEDDIVATVTVVWRLGLKQ